MSIKPSYLEPTDENGRLVFERGLTGPVTMLNLLRFRAKPTSPLIAS
jgi:hypothetical protein